MNFYRSHLDSEPRLQGTGGEQADTQGDR